MCRLCACITRALILSAMESVGSEPGWYDTEGLRNGGRLLRKANSTPPLRDHGKAMPKISGAQDETTAGQIKRFWDDLRDSCGWNDCDLVTRGDLH